MIGTFGTATISVPRARAVDENGKTTEWRSKALPRYPLPGSASAGCMSGAADQEGRSAHCLGVSGWDQQTRVKQALYGLFESTVSKDVVSRAWRKAKGDWDIWVAHDLACEDIVRLILDGTVIKTRLDDAATNISVLAAIGLRRPSRQICAANRLPGNRRAEGAVFHHEYG